MDWLAPLYPWVKALHIISVISWMAGMLYLPRLFIYHCDADVGSEKSETFKIMERRLLKFIMTPAMVASWFFGLSMLMANPGMLSGQGWMHVKLLFVVLMSGVHGILAAHVRKFANDQNLKDAKFFCILNEAPTLLMIAIVILAVVQPF